MKWRQKRQQRHY